MSDHRPVGGWFKERAGTSLIQSVVPLSHTARSEAHEPGKVAEYLLGVGSGIAFLGLLPLIVAVCVWSIPAAAFLASRTRRREQRTAVRLGEVGRWVEWADIEDQFGSGHGTLIIEWWFPKEPIRQWWTEDNVLDDVVRRLPRSMRPDLAEDKRLVKVATRIAMRYTHVDFGRAKRVNLPPAKVLPQAKSLTVTHPRGRVVTIVYLNRPVLLMGDQLAILEEHEEDCAEWDTG